MGLGFTLVAASVELGGGAAGDELTLAGDSLFVTALLSPAALVDEVEAGAVAGADAGAALKEGPATRCGGA